MYKATTKTSSLYLGLQKQAEISRKKLAHRHPHVTTYLSERGITPGRIREHAAKVAATAAMAGAMLFGHPITQQVLSSPTHQIATLSSEQLRTTLTNQLKALLPHDVRPLTSQEEDAISKELHAIWGIDARGTLEGEHLNTTYGLMGAEQHLMRYPGDVVENMAPGRGAWGYFARSKQDMTQELYEKEKWYVAVQTLYLPDWNTRTRELRDFYQYRKVLVINPVNGKTVVADIADAGPASWTGKHFGGSPEVMEYLGLNVHMQKGPVILFFVNDPGGEVPLGPVEYNVKVGTPV